MLLKQIALFLHLLSFAAFVGAGFAQTRFVAASLKAAEKPVRDLYERLAKLISTRIELPAITLSLITGGLLILERPALFRELFMHIKLGAVMGLLVLAHVEMFGLIKIVRLRQTNADSAATEAEIARLKARHALFGTLGALLVITVIVMVVIMQTAGTAMAIAVG